MIWKCFNLILLLLVSLVYSKDLNIVFNDSIFGILNDIKYTTLLKGKYQINKKIAASLLTIYDIDIKLIARPRKFMTSKTPKNDTIIRFEGVQILADLSTRYLFSNHNIKVDVLFDLDFKVSFPNNKLEISDFKMKFQEFHLFGQNNAISNKIWKIISNVIEEQDILNVQKDSINTALNKFLNDNHKLELSKNTFEFSVQSINRLLNKNYDVWSKNLMVLDINTNYNKDELDKMEGMPINIDKYSFEYDASVYASKQYIMNMLSLDIIPEINNDILKLRVDIKDIELKKIQDLLIVFKVNAYVTPKKGKEVLKTFTIYLNLVDNGIDDIKFNISVDGMDLIMRTLYKAAGLQAKLNEYVESQMKVLKTKVVNAFQSIFWPNIRPERMNIFVFDNMIMLALKITK